jgi:DNA-binding beta-propeller fold protein YncE
MQQPPAQEITWADPHGHEPHGWQADLSLPAIFLGAAALVLAVIDPIYIGYKPQTFLTLLLAGLGAGALGYGAYRRDMRFYFGATVYLFVLLAWSLATQPVQLGVPLASVLPFRLVLFALVLGAWVFLMRPPMWARRAIAFVGVPVLLVTGLVSGPVVAAQLQGLPLPRVAFSPYWVAVNSQGTVYATNADGNAIWVFAPGGGLVGTIWPATAQGPGQPGPGILPAVQPTPIIRPYDPFNTLPPPPANAPGPQYPTVLFCGLAVDPDDNLLLVNNATQKLEKYNAKGDLLVQWPLPPLFDGSKGCIAADATYIYIASRFGSVYVLDRQANVLLEVKLEYQPFGLSPDGKGALLVLGPFQMDRINPETGGRTPVDLPPPTGQLRIPYQALLVTRAGQLLATDVATNRVLRLSLQGGQILGSIGEAGFYPGQFQGLGGLAEDREGRIYVADWQNGAVQRFTARGELDRVYWALAPATPAPITEEEEE